MSDKNRWNVMPFQGAHFPLVYYFNLRLYFILLCVEYAV